MQATACYISGVGKYRLIFLKAQGRHLCSRGFRLPWSIEHVGNNSPYACLLDGVVQRLLVGNADKTDILVISHKVFFVLKWRIRCRLLFRCPKAAYTTKTTVFVHNTRSPPFRKPYETHNRPFLHRRAAGRLVRPFILRAKRVLLSRPQRLRHARATRPTV